MAKKIDLRLVFNEFCSKVQFDNFMKIHPEMLRSLQQ